MFVVFSPFRFRWALEASRWPQDGPREPQEGPKRAPRRPQERPKTLFFGLREGSRSWAGGVRHGITCVWTGYRRVLAGRKVRTAIRQLLTQCQTAAEPTDSTPNVVTCHVTVISWLDRERHAPFLIRHPGKSHVDFLMPRFLNAREQL